MLSILPTIITSLINDALEDITVSVQRVDDMDDAGPVYDDGQDDTDSWCWHWSQPTPGLVSLDTRCHSRHKAKSLYMCICEIYTVNLV